MKRVLIIGGVAAGATAAARARRLDGEAEITMLEAGPDVSFANCGLPYYIGGDIENRSSLILQSPEAFKDQYNVTVHTETEARSIDRKAKKVRAHGPNGEVEYPYDLLILAQGGKPIVPPLPGVDQDNVLSLWTLEDMDAIDDFISRRNPKTAVVVGAGFIGLEMVEALAKRGLSVSVVERTPQIMPNLVPEIAGHLMEDLEAYGVAVHSSKSVTAVEKNSVTLDDGSSLNADLVIMSVGVRPTLNLAKEAGLTLGESGALLVDEYLKTNDDNIYAAGDMVEITHRISGKGVKIPLAGPANRQGRLAATNGLAPDSAGRKPYVGSAGTSIVRVFDAVAASTGLSLDQATKAGLDADAVVVHKEQHTSYYPGAQDVTVYLVYERASGRVLGGQTAGFDGADKRIDVIATAAAGAMTIDQLAELDLAYAPPFGTPNDPVNMAAFVAQNKQSGYSPAVLAADFDSYVKEHNPQVVDIRDYFAFERAHVASAIHIPLTHLERRQGELNQERPVLLISDKGKKAHQASRLLQALGFTSVAIVSGGFISLERHNRVEHFSVAHLPLVPVEGKSFEEAEADGEATESAEEKTGLEGTGPIVVDVRTPEEFSYGAYPGAVNIPLDELAYEAEKLGPAEREITLYCASGARSAYGARMLAKMGFTNVTNGGGLMDMMASMG